MKDKSENSCLSQKTNQGISCSVKDCAYHDGINCCTAKVINVGPQNATSSVDTSCVTFRLKSQS
ncbi:MAG: DUF1540 domain-containing protein [Firmicutes bacterium]|nr:DUF1540 domain-containing protein [Bacillota bacterium]